MVDNWVNYISRCLIDTYMGIKFLNNSRQVISHLLNILISLIKPLNHIVHHISNMWHITISFPITIFQILNRYIRTNPIIFVALFFFVVVVAIVIPIQDILTLLFVVVETLVSLTLTLISCIGTLCVWSETPRLIICRISILFIVIFLTRWWSSYLNNWKHLTFQYLHLHASNLVLI